MIGFNKVTKEEIRDLDPSDDNDLYYQLDKRLWEFHEELEEPSPVAVVHTLKIGLFGMMIKDREELRITATLANLKQHGVWISDTGHLVGIGG